MAERSTRLLGQLDHRAVVEHAAKIVAPRRSLEEIANRQDRLIRTLGSQDDHTGTIFTRVRYRLGELEAERHATFDALAELDAADVTQVIPVDLLDELPVPTHRPARRRAGGSHRRAA